jgi:hypothetical protein
MLIAFSLKNLIHSFPYGERNFGAQNNLTLLSSGFPRPCRCAWLFYP